MLSGYLYQNSCTENTIIHATIIKLYKETWWGDPQVGLGYTCVYAHVCVHMCAQV